MRLLGVLLLLALTGCATLSENECRSADWYELGEHDGFAGYPRARIEEHAEACGKIGIHPNRDAYFSGREQGVYRYCEPRHGYEVGRAGESYRNVCSGERETRFLRQYRAGRQLYDLEQQIRRGESEIGKLEQQLEKASSDTERARLRGQIAERDREQSLLRRQLRTLESM